MPTFLLAAAAWWGLQAQYLSEGELAFQFSGQTVTLDVDRTGYYEAAMGRLNEFLQNNLSTTKQNMMRQASAGVSAGRPYSFRHGPFVARVGTTKDGGNQLYPISKLGLLL